jgi:hypothetical protein
MATASSGEYSLFRSTNFATSRYFLPYPITLLLVARHPAFLQNGKATHLQRRDDLRVV